MLMPLLKNKVPVQVCQVLGLAQLIELEAKRLPESGLVSNLEYGFSVPPAYVNVDRTVIVAVEKEPKPVLGEDGRHSR